MSDQYPKGQGALFHNDRREKDSHPHFRGNIELSREQINELVRASKDGKEMKLQVAGWKKVSANGTKYISLQTEAYFPPDKSPRKGQGRPAPKRQADEWDDDEPSIKDDDIPF